MVSLIEKNKNAIVALCKKHQVKSLYAFGSAVRDNDFTRNSDIDLLADFNNQPHLENAEELLHYFENLDMLNYELENLFNRHVDLLTEKNIRNKYLKEIINSEKQLIYAQA